VVGAAAGVGGAAGRSALRSQPVSEGAASAANTQAMRIASEHTGSALSKGDQKRGIGGRCFHNLPAVKAHAMAETTPHEATGADRSVPSLECRGVTRELRSGDTLLTVLHAVDLRIAAGEAVAIVGPSGSGKSTLLGLLAGLDRPTSGQVLIDGLALDGMDEDQLARLRRDRLGFVFQNFQLLGNLTARENVLLTLELAGVQDAAARCDDLLARVGLGQRGHHYPAQLSGGEQQRVALARAFAPRPRILLADEPTGNLDPETSASVLALLFGLREQYGTTLVIVTHDADVADRTGRRIRLAGGRVVQAQEHAE
jgi:putative ABC transport system ATP-binding protein